MNYVFMLILNIHIFFLKLHHLFPSLFTASQMINGLPINFQFNMLHTLSPKSLELLIYYALILINDIFLEFSDFPYLRLPLMLQYPKCINFFINTLLKLIAENILHLLPVVNGYIIYPVHQFFVCFLKNNFYSHHDFFPSEKSLAELLYSEMQELKHKIRLKYSKF